MSRDDRIRRDVIGAIMCQGAVYMDAVETLNDVVFEDYFAAELRQLLALQADGLVEIGDRKIALTAVGRLLMRSVAMVFDAYLGTESAPAAMSRVM
jgi:oxygen-independent coproporphyrinogen-3 oxidase